MNRKEKTEEEKKEGGRERKEGRKEGRERKGREGEKERKGTRSRHERVLWGGVEGNENGYDQYILYLYKLQNSQRTNFKNIV